MPFNPGCDGAIKGLTGRGPTINIPILEYPDMKYGWAMNKREPSKKNLDAVDEQMFLVRKFMAEFYDKTVFQKEANLNSDLTASRIKSLFAFEDESLAYPIGELGRNARVKRSTITDMVDRLERDGIAERYRDDRDRRVVKVRLTETGKRMRREFNKKRRKEMEALFSKLNEREKRMLLNHLYGAYRLLKKIKIYRGG